MKPTRKGIIAKAEKAFATINSNSPKRDKIGDNGIIEECLSYPGNVCELRDMQLVTRRDGKLAFTVYAAYEDGDCWRVLVSVDAKAIYDGNENDDEQDGSEGQDTEQPATDPDEPTQEDLDFCKAYAQRCLRNTFGFAPETDDIELLEVIRHPDNVVMPLNLLVAVNKDTWCGAEYRCECGDAGLNARWEHGKRVEK